MRTFRFKRRRRPFRRLARGQARCFRTVRKRAFRQKRRGRASTLIIRQPTVMPDRLKIKFRFTEIISMVSTGGALNYYQWRGNSLFDPDLTGAGAQPYGFDQWSSFYQYYRVLGSSITVTPIAPPAAAAGFGSSIVYGIYPHNTITNTPASGIQSLERPYRKWTMLSGAKGYSSVKNYMTTAKIFGETKQSVMSEDNYQAANTTNPTNQWQWTVFMFTGDTASNSATIPFYVTITYYTVLSDRAQLAVS